MPNPPAARLPNPAAARLPNPAAARLPNPAAAHMPDPPATQAQTRAGPGLQALATPGIHLHVLLVALCLAVAACGGHLGGSLASGRAGAEPSPTERYVASLRLAALGRVETRGGLDEMAAEHFRAAYRKHPAVEHLVAAAKAAERGKLFAEAHDSMRRALQHELVPDDRVRAEQEVARLEALVPPALVRVTVQVAPEGARVELTRQNGGSSPKASRGYDRLVLGSGWVFLQAGTWAVHSTNRGYQSELQTIQLQADGGELVAVALQLEDTGPQLADPARPKGTRPEELLGPDENKTPELQGPVVEFNMDTKPKRSAVHTWGPLGLSVLGVVAVGGGGWFGFQAAQNGLAASDLGNQKLSKAQYDSDLSFYVGAAQSNAELANYAFIGGGALLALGSVWWWLAPSAKTADDAVAPKMAGAARRPSTLAAIARRLPVPTVVPHGFGLHWSF